MPKSGFFKLVFYPRLTRFQVVDDPGVPGSEGEEEGPVGCQLQPSTLESHL